MLNVLRKRKSRASYPDSLHFVAFFARLCFRMDNGWKTTCDWKDCGSLAASHVRYGFSADLDSPKAVSFHGDYCLRHSGYIGETFTNTRMTTLGECPDGCDLGGMKIIQAH